jgi:hypothetical protein
MRRLYLDEMERILRGNMFVNRDVIVNRVCLDAMSYLGGSMVSGEKLTVQIHSLILNILLHVLAKR